jgi:serine-type D-Ala-D-Ala endopeptidase (penicillin-binding protein 7)
MVQQRKRWRHLAVATGALAMLAAPLLCKSAGETPAARYPVAAGKTDVHKAAQSGLAAAGLPGLKSTIALVVDLVDGQTIYGKNVEHVTPIASITKLMTAMVTLDAELPLAETIVIDHADVDQLKHTGSRLTVGTGLSRADMLRLALMSSENRAAASLSRVYPGGREAFIAAMNRKAVELGMFNTRFVDPTGLSSENVSTAQDLARMVKAAYEYALIREFTTTPEHMVATTRGRSLQFRNSNGLVKSPTWEIGLSKTGYISEAGRCLVMQAKIAARPVVIVLLDSWGKNTRLGDANRIKKWLESRLGHKPVG